MPTPTIWHIPYQQNPYFTGREEVLSQLYRSLHAESTVALSHPQGISGLGGIGKTQTALEYAYRYRGNYAAIFWVRADSITALTSSLVELAQVLELPERHEQDQEIIVQAVLRWFRLHTDWLLIYDNIDDLSIAEPFLPKAGAGHLLFTTRAHAFGGLAQRLDIQKMEPDIGALLLLRRADIITLEALLDTANSDDQRIARAISQEVDGLPLALDQAGAYIKEAPCPLPDYLIRYQTRRSDLLQERGHFNQDYPASVATTWSLSFERIGQVNPASAELLNFCAFLAPDAIPEEIITKGAPHLGNILYRVVTNPIQLDQICKEVLRFSLFQRGTDTQTLSIHRLVQAILRDVLPVETQRQWIQRAIHAINQTFPSAEFAYWSTCERCLPHALVCATLIEREHLVFPETAALLNKIGFYLDDRVRYTEAEPFYQRAIFIYEQQLGPDAPLLAGSLNDLALLYSNQGRYADAEPLYQRAISIKERQLGSNDPSTATSLNNLALLYYYQGKYTQAEPLYRRALEIREQQLGPSDPYTALSLNNLAALYYSMGKYVQAESLLVRALEIREQQLGPDHAYTAESLNNLAALYRVQRKYAEAEPLLIRSVTIYEQQLGPDQPYTASSLNNLAELYRVQGKYADAEPLYRRALEIREQQLGLDHHETAISLHNLALLYDHQKKYTQAEPLYQHALAIRKQILGEEHLDTIQTLNNLAALYEKQGKYIEAEPLYQRVFLIRKQQLGDEHPDTIESLNNLASFYSKQGKYVQNEFG